MILEHRGGARPYATKPVTAVLDPDNGNILRYSAHYPGYEILDKPFQGLPGDIAWVIGASQVIRLDVFRKIDGFDEGFFLYFEDSDICLRVRQAGYEVGFIENLTVKHFGSGSVRKSHIYDSKK